MNQIRCFILDDEPMAISLLTEYAKKIPQLLLVGSSTSALEALKLFEEETIDLLFIDIQMPELTGLQIMDILGNRTKYIVTSAYSEYALKGYEYQVLDYLLKPISFERFYKSVQKAKDYFQPVVQPSAPAISAPQVKGEADFLFVKTDGKLIKIFLKDLLFIEGLKDYLCLHLRQEKIIILDTFLELEKKLPSDDFMRVHKSYVVRLDQIDTIERNRIFINDKIIPIGKTYVDHFQRWVKEHH
ncbi:LytR/AlgR family response regulator transcription factor [Myroides odoratus]|uniref:Probable transcriptional regulatory protein YehT n=1 Tax=Myroides odoratus TaxID=256 RepID=A0A378U514_MYROD|nr:LytTR family DNA-binding domain-containing protein [Myroides odoratus]MCS4237249.1 DNA-binding LytR/AlgR family response regulator [Myroides odoratus]QQU03186.1 response regulator transcription factor [Myroides odoratus]STZ69560.1 Probable transcriptional regulatory protein YehT [Myroides odoratus]